jgi:hypothetical protein
MQNLFLYIYIKSIIDPEKIDESSFTTRKIILTVENGSNNK